MVAHGTPCLGPVTHAGCGALCPSLPPRLLRLLRADGGRPTPRSLGGWLADHGDRRRDVVRLYRTFYAGAPAFRERDAMS